MNYAAGSLAKQDLRDQAPAVASEERSCVAPYTTNVFEVWTAEDDNAEDLARRLEARLNEYAAQVISVSYTVADKHFVMAVYQPVQPLDDDALEAAVEVAEEIVAQAQD